MESVPNIIFAAANLGLSADGDIKDPTCSDYATRPDDLFAMTQLLVLKEAAEKQRQIEEMQSALAKQQEIEVLTDIRDTMNLRLTQEDEEIEQLQAEMEQHETHSNSSYDSESGG